MMSWFTAIPHNKYITSQNFVADFVFSTNMGKKQYLVNYGFEFTWKTEKRQSKITREWLVIKGKGELQEYNKIIDRSWRCLYDYGIDLKVKDNELMLNKL